MLAASRRGSEPTLSKGENYLKVSVLRCAPEAGIITHDLVLSVFKTPRFCVGGEDGKL